MRFGVPVALWLLLALPGIVLLYMLRARRQEVLTSSILLWQRARQDLLVRMPIRRLERNLLLLLQLLAAGLAILAVAQPQVALTGPRSDALVVVLDTSVSMQATDVLPSRFEVARRQALALVAEATGPVMVIEAGRMPHIAQPFADRAQARGALERLRPTDAPGRLEEAVGLGLSQRTPLGPAHVIVFTDHVTTPLAGVGYRVIGESSRNLGIAGLHVEPTGGGSHVVVQVHNWGQLSERVPVVLTLDGRRVLERVISVAPSSRVAVSGTVQGHGILRAELQVDDPLSVDDVAYGIVGAPLPRVVVIGEESRVLDQALAAMPVQYVPTRRVTPEAFAAADVVILNRTDPVALPPGNYLLLGTTATNLPLQHDGLRRGPQILRWSPTHPIMRYVDLAGVQIEEALALRPQGGEILAEGEDPLIWSYDGGGIRAVVVAFPLDRTDLPLQVAFPVFLANVLKWLGGGDAVYSAGDPFIQSARGFNGATLVDPTGARRLLQAASGRFVVPSLDKVGVYTLQVGERTRTFVVNPSPEGSAIAPVGADQMVARAPVRSEQSINLWPVFLVLALAVLLAEWGLWVRRLPRTDLGRPRVTVRP